MAGFTEYALTAGRLPLACCTGPDGNVWYISNGGASRVCKITPAGTVTEYACPDTAADLQDICAGPDGNLWVLGYTSNKIYKVTTGGSFTSYSSGITAAAGLYSICAGPDGNLWFTEFSANKVGKITTGGTVTEYSSGITASSQPIGIGSDGTNLWFTEYHATNGNRVCKITTSGTVTEYAISTSNFKPVSAVLGPDGRIWVGSFNTDKVLAVTVSDGTRTEYTVTTGTAKPGLLTVVGDRLYALTVTDQKLVPITTAGVAGTAQTIPTASAGVQSRITTGADGSSVWFCEYSQAKIGKLDGLLNVTQAVAIKTYAQPTKTQAVATAVVGATQVTKTLEGIVTADPATTVNSRWSSVPSGTSGLATITSGEVVFTDGTPYYRVLQSQQNSGAYTLQIVDCAISFDLHPVTAADGTYALRLRLYKDASNYYEIRVAKTAAGTSDLRKVVAGTPTSLGTVAKGVAVGTTKRIHIHRTGTTLDIYIDGSRIGPITDSAFTGALNITADALTGTSDVRVGRFNVANGSSVKIRNVPTGGSARVYDSSGSVLASGTESSGTVTLDLTTQSFPVTGYFQIFTDSSYTTPATDGRFPGDDGTGIRSTADIYGADELHYQLTAYKVIGNHFGKYYATTQSNAHNGVIYNGNYAYGLAIGYENSLVAFKRDLSVEGGQGETHQVGGVGTLVDQHAVCDIVVDSAGYLHAMYGGYAYGYSMYYMKSNTPYGWNDWGSPSIVVAAEGWSGGLMIDQADKLHFVGTVAGSDGYTGSAGVKYLSKASGGSWSAATTLIGTEVSSGYFFIFGDCTIGKEPSGQQSLNVTLINTNGTTWRAYFMRSTDGGSTWRGLNAGAYTLPLSVSGGIVSGCEQPYTGTDAYVVRLAADPDTTTMHATMQKLSDASNPVYIRGTTAGGWAAPSQTFTGFNTGPAIETILSNVVVLGAIVGTPNTVKRYNSTDGGVTWKGPTTMVTDTNTSYPPEWYWAKATRIPNSENLRVLWQSRHSGYTAGSTLTDTGEGTASLYLADVQAVSAKTQTVAIPTFARQTKTQAVAVPVIASGTKTQSVAIPVVTRGTKTQSVAVPVTATAASHSVTQTVAIRVVGTVVKTQAVAVVVYDGTPGPTVGVTLPASADFVSARSQTAQFVSARSQTADFTSSPTT